MPRWRHWTTPALFLTFALTGPQADIDGQNRHTGQNYEERGRTFNALRGQITRIRPGLKAEVVGSVGDKKELATFIRNVKRWRDGSMIERWVRTAVFDASRKFRRVRGYAAIPALAAALDRREPLATTAAAA